MMVPAYSKTRGVFGISVCLYRRVINWVVGKALSALKF
jgi:hypothetical protein